jgi:acyl-homoserine-lactone acylase
MTSRLVTVQVRGAGGRLRPVRRRLWSTRWGPVITALPVVGQPLRWTASTAFALTDANATNVRLLDTSLAIGRSRSAPEVLRALRRWQGLAWFQALVADRAGRALLADISVVPHVSDARAASCNTELGRALFPVVGIAVLDGSRSSCRWGRDADAVEPGLLGPARQPQLFRDDYVTNSNDSHWLSNPHQPLEGFPRIIGDEGSPRSLRTRIGLVMTQARVDGSDDLGPPGFTRGDMQRLMFSNRQYAGELTRDALVGVCRAVPGGQAPTSNGRAVPVANACDVLARWDLREDLDSRGAILFRGVWENLYRTSKPDSWWMTPFDRRDPVHTPNTLDTTRPGVRTALGDAIAALRAARVPLDARVGDVQHISVRGRRIPLHGGPGDPYGQFNVIASPFDRRNGVGEAQFGDTYIQAVTWNAGPCPDAATILTYSQSTNPRSPFFADQAPLFRRKQWVPVRFCRRDVLRHTRSTTVLTPTR